MKLFLRIHLLTGVLLMLTASLLLWLNLRPQPTGASVLFHFPAAQPGADQTLFVTPDARFGWPWAMLHARRSKDALALAASSGTRYAEVLVSNEGIDHAISAQEEDGPVRVISLPPPTVLSGGTLQTPVLLKNLVVAWAILCAVGTLSEVLQRWVSRMKKLS